jgi:hypothetical protein
MKSAKGMKPSQPVDRTTPLHTLFVLIRLFTISFLFIEGSRPFNFPKTFPELPNLRMTVSLLESRRIGGDHPPSIPPLILIL